MTVVGNRNGYVGIALGKASETVPAREKSLRQAKLNIIKIPRGCGSWECDCKEPHSVPFTVKGKCGSVIMILKTAPKGTGLTLEKECRKVLELAGIKDVYSKTYGHTNTKMNLIKACFKALQQISRTRMSPEFIKNSGVVEGAV